MMYSLTLFVTGHTSTSRQAMENIRQICEEFLPGQYRLSIIDVLDQPHRAEEQRILATPTLIREHPLPSRRIIGDLSNKERVLRGLDITPPARNHSEHSNREKME